MSEVIKILKKYSASIDHEIEEALSTINPKALRDSSNHLTVLVGKKNKAVTRGFELLSCRWQIRIRFKNSSSNRIDPLFSIDSRRYNGQR